MRKSSCFLILLGSSLNMLFRDKAKYLISLKTLYFHIYIVQYLLSIIIQAYDNITFFKDDSLLVLRISSKFYCNSKDQNIHTTENTLHFKVIILNVGVLIHLRLLHSEITAYGLSSLKNWSQEKQIPLYF